jgi:hypothetical protein
MQVVFSSLNVKLLTLYRLESLEYASGGGDVPAIEAFFEFRD